MKQLINLFTKNKKITYTIFNGDDKMSFYTEPVKHLKKDEFSKVISEIKKYEDQLPFVNSFEQGKGVKATLYCCPGESRDISLGSGLINLYSSNISIGEYPSGYSSVFHKDASYIIFEESDMERPKEIECIKLFDGMSYRRKTNKKSNGIPNLFAKVLDVEVGKKCGITNSIKTDLSLFNLGPGNIKGNFVVRNKDNSVAYDFDL